MSENALVSRDLGLGRVLGKMIAWESVNGGYRDESRRDRVGGWKEVGRKKRRRGRRWEGRNTETSGGLRECC